MAIKCFNVGLDRGDFPNVLVKELKCLESTYLPSLFIPYLVVSKLILNLHVPGPGTFESYKE